MVGEIISWNCPGSPRRCRKTRQAFGDGDNELVRLERLLQAQNGSQSGSHVQKVRFLFRGQPELLPGNDEDRHFRTRLMNELHRLEAIHPGHKNIDDEQVEAAGSKQLQTSSAIVGNFDHMCGAFEQHLDSGKDRSIIVNDENVRHGSLAVSFVQPKVTYSSTGLKDRFPIVTIFDDNA